MHISFAASTNNSILASFNNNGAKHLSIRIPWLVAVQLTHGLLLAKRRKNLHFKVLRFHACAFVEFPQGGKQISTAFGAVSMLYTIVERSIFKLLMVWHRKPTAIELGVRQHGKLGNHGVVLFISFFSLRIDGSDYALGI